MCVCVFGCCGFVDGVSVEDVGYGCWLAGWLVGWAGWLVGWLVDTHHPTKPKPQDDDDDQRARTNRDANKLAGELAPASKALAGQ